MIWMTNDFDNKLKKEAKNNHLFIMMTKGCSNISTYGFMSAPNLTEISPAAQVALLQTEMCSVKRFWAKMGMNCGMVGCTWIKQALVKSPNKANEDWRTSGIGSWTHWYSKCMMFELKKKNNDVSTFRKYVVFDGELRAGHVGYYLLCSRGKSLLELLATLFLPDWQPPLIFVQIYLKLLLHVL